MVQKVLRFSDHIRNMVTNEHSVFFDDFDEQNVENDDAGGYGDLADKIINEGIKEGFLDKEDLENLDR